MKHGAMRQITWDPTAIKDTDVSATAALSMDLHKVEMFAEELAAVKILPRPPQLTPTPRDAVEEVRILLQIAAEVEGALMVQYLFAAYSLLPGLSLILPTIDHPVLSDDWYDIVRDIAKQEMGHLMTVQNLLLSIDAPAHLDRENLPWEHQDLYPFPFHIQALGLEALAEDVTAEAPRAVSEGDRADYEEAVVLANGVIGQISRVGQIYERLYWLFQDSDIPQSPWTDLINPFPEWPKWHLPPELVGFNQDRQATSEEWRGNDSSVPPDTAIYVLTATDKATARNAIFQIARQGEGPFDAGGALTHFNKFLRLYREFRAYSQQAGVVFVRNQVRDPSTRKEGGSGSITDATTLEWARLSNVRYQMLLLHIALSLSIGAVGFAPGTTARRRDFIAWAFGSEMLTSIKKIAEELRTMPVKANAPADSLRAGLPFELPDDHDLPTTGPEQISELRTLVLQSQTIRKNIQETLAPTARQQAILAVLEHTDKDIFQKIGSPPNPDEIA